MTAEFHIAARSGAKQTPEGVGRLALMVATDRT